MDASTIAGRGRAARSELRARGQRRQGWDLGPRRVEVSRFMAPCWRGARRPARESPSFPRRPHGMVNPLRAAGAVDWCLRGRLRRGPHQAARPGSSQFVCGTSGLAVATALAACMGGLAAGAATAVRWVTRIARPVLVYGWLELDIALAALGMPVAIATSRALHVDLCRGSEALADAAGGGATSSAARSTRGRHSLSRYARAGVGPAPTSPCVGPGRSPRSPAPVRSIASRSRA